MDARIVQQTAARIAGLNPFDMASAAVETQRVRVKKRELAHPRQPEDKMFDEPEEFGCVDWYLYPERYPAKGPGARD